MNEQNRTRGMETKNSLTVTRGEGEGEERDNKGKWLVKEHVWMTHGHGQQDED